MRSRATRRPSLCWRSWPALPPPSRNCSSSARILPQRSRIVSALALRDDMRWTLNPAQALLQARGLAELAPPLGHLKRYERFTPWRAELRDAYATQARENSPLCEI